MPSRPITARAAVVAGALFIVEGTLGPFTNSEIQYHAPNSLLNLALAVAALGIYRWFKGEIGKSGRIGARVCVFGASIAGLGGLVSVLYPLLGGNAPGVVEGVVHSAVLLAIVAIVPLAVGLRKLVPVPGLVLAVGSFVIIAMVLVGLDDPWIFLGPEAVLGIAWIRLGAVLNKSESLAVEPPGRPAPSPGLPA